MLNYSAKCVKAEYNVNIIVINKWYSQEECNNAINIKYRDKNPLAILNH